MQATAAFWTTGNALQKKLPTVSYGFIRFQILKPYARMQNAARGLGHGIHFQVAGSHTCRILCIHSPYRTHNRPTPAACAPRSFRRRETADPRPDNARTRQHCLCRAPGHLPLTDSHSHSSALPHKTQPRPRHPSLLPPNTHTPKHLHKPTARKIVAMTRSGLGASPRALSAS